jgi:hypothetical protein
VPNLNLKERKGSWPIQLSKILAPKAKGKYTIMNKGDDEVDTFWMIQKLSNLVYAESQITGFVT